MMVLLNGMVAEADDVDGDQVEQDDSLLDETLPPLDGSADLSDDEPEDDDIDQASEADESSITPLATTSPRMATLLREIAEAETLCANAEEAVTEAKAVLKEAKAEYDGCVMRLRRLAKALRNDQDRPLLDGLDAGSQVDVEASESAGDPDAQYDALLASPLDALKLPAGIVAKLTEAGVATVGDLEQLREDIMFDRKSWPRGIGPAKVDVIEDAVVDWLSANEHDVVPSDVDGEDDDDETEVNDDDDETDEE
jgi:hypothetical protein